MSKTFTVAVSVATCRPPRHDAFAFVTLDAIDHLEAMRVAAQMVDCHPHVVMTLSAKVL